MSGREVKGDRDEDRPLFLVISAHPVPDASYDCKVIGPHKDMDRGGILGSSEGNLVAYLHGSHATPFENVVGRRFDAHVALLIRERPSRFCLGANWLQKEGDEVPRLKTKVRPASSTLKTYRRDIVQEIFIEYE